MAWIEYDETSGRIIQLVDAVDKPVAEMGGVVMAVQMTAEQLPQYMVVAGALLDLGPAPSTRHEIDLVARAWVVPGGTSLQVAQDAKWAEIKAERDRLETAGFPYLGKWIDSDARSVQRITGAVQAAQAALADGAPFEIGWTTADNSVLQLDAEQMMGMTVALAARANTLHVIARQLREEIYAEAATEASVATVAWPTE